MAPIFLNDAEPLLDEVSGEPPVAIPSESASAQTIGVAATAAAPGAGVAEGDSANELTGSTMGGIALPRFRRGSVIKEALIDYLVEDGLAESDSERIVGAALDALAACRKTFRESDADRVACDGNVISEAGMHEAFRRLSREVLDRNAREPAQQV